MNGDSWKDVIEGSAGDFVSFRFRDVCSLKNLEPEGSLG